MGLPCSNSAVLVVILACCTSCRSALMQNGMLMATKLRICWHAVVPTDSNTCSSNDLCFTNCQGCDPAGSAAAPVQMPLPPTLTPSQATAGSAPQAANGQADASEAGNRDSDASAPTPGLQTPPKNGKRRRGGRVSHCYLLCIFMCSTDVSNLSGWSVTPGLTVPTHHVLWLD